MCNNGCKRCLLNIYTQRIHLLVGLGLFFLLLLLVVVNWLVMFSYPEGVWKTSKNSERIAAGMECLPFFLQIQWTVQGWVLSKGWPSAGDRISSVLWCMVLMHDSWSQHAIMQIISMHWTNTMFGIGLSKSSTAWRNLIVFPHPSLNHVKPMWRRCSFMSKKLTSKWHGLNVSVCVFSFCCLA